MQKIAESQTRTEEIERQKEEQRKRESITRDIRGRSRRKTNSNEADFIESNSEV
jgi:hypothetical protein